jgi:hypothetical protein
VRTAPCPRCSSLNTEVVADAQTKVVIVRHCLDCRYAWDFMPASQEDEDSSFLPPGSS